MQSELLFSAVTRHSDGISAFRPDRLKDRPNDSDPPVVIDGEDAIVGVQSTRCGTIWIDRAYVPSVASPIGLPTVICLQRAVTVNHHAGENVYPDHEQAY